MTISPLTGREMEAWYGLIRAHAVVVRQLSTELEVEHGLSLAAYEVLAHLSDAPDKRMRMTELTECTSLSPSGLTRLIDKLVRDGLVERMRCAADGRVVYAVLTSGGTSRLRRAYPTHLRGVRQHMIDRIDAAEVDAVAAAMAKLLDARL